MVQDVAQCIRVRRIWGLNILAALLIPEICSESDLQLLNFLLFFVTVQVCVSTLEYFHPMCDSVLLL